MKRIYYKRGYKYQLSKPYIIQTSIKPTDPIYTEYIGLGTDGVMIIKRGYAWDGASGPAIDTRSFMRGSLVHDALYQLIRTGYLPLICRQKADDMLKKICLEDGMSKLRAWYVYQAIRKFGAIANNEPVIEYAP